MAEWVWGVIGSRDDRRLLADRHQTGNRWSRDVHPLRRQQIPSPTSTSSPPRFLSYNYQISLSISHIFLIACCNYTVVTNRRDVRHHVPRGDLRPAPLRLRVQLERAPPRLPRLLEGTSHLSYIAHLADRQVAHLADGAEARPARQQAPRRRLALRALWPFVPCSGDCWCDSGSGGGAEAARVGEAESAAYGGEPGGAVWAQRE